MLTPVFNEPFSFVPGVGKDGWQLFEPLRGVSKYKNLKLNHLTHKVAFFEKEWICLTRRWCDSVIRFEATLRRHMDAIRR